ncbi:MAG: hypothetical protein RAK21_03410 [Synechococcus sp. SP2 MAG]|nr:hypothetical protein [Synechococcus sp. SP2 MAG]
MATSFPDPAIAFDYVLISVLRKCVVICVVIFYDGGMTACCGAL